MRYRLWDTDINQLFGTFDTEVEALSLVRSLVSTYGDTAADDLSLSYEHGDGSCEPALTGADLVARAEEVMAQRVESAARRGEVTATRSGSSGVGG